MYKIFIKIILFSSLCANFSMGMENSNIPAGQDSVPKKNSAKIQWIDAKKKYKSASIHNIASIKEHLCNMKKIPTNIPISKNDLDISENISWKKLIKGLTAFKSQDNNLYNFYLLNEIFDHSEKKYQCIISQLINNNYRIKNCFIFIEKTTEGIIQKILKEIDLGQVQKKTENPKNLRINTWKNLFKRITHEKEGEMYQKINEYTVSWYLLKKKKARCIGQFTYNKQNNIYELYISQKLYDVKAVENVSYYGCVIHNTNISGYKAHSLVFIPAFTQDIPNYLQNTYGLTEVKSYINEKTQPIDASYQFSSQQNQSVDVPLQPSNKRQLPVSAPQNNTYNNTIYNFTNNFYFNSPIFYSQKNAQENQYKFSESEKLFLNFVNTVQEENMETPSKKMRVDLPPHDEDETISDSEEE